jgi:predicted DNA binding CopG/RHH family protein
MRQIPKFKSEAEELAFWDEHDVSEFDAGPAEEIIWELAPEKKRMLSLRVEPSLVVALKALAAERQVPYQALARRILEQGVEQLSERRRAPDLQRKAS